METCTEKRDNLFVTVTFKKSPACASGVPDSEVQHIDIEIDEKRDENGEFLEIKVHRSKDHRKPKF